MNIIKKFAHRDKHSNVPLSLSCSSEAQSDLNISAGINPLSLSQNALSNSQNLAQSQTILTSSLTNSNDNLQQHIDANSINDSSEVENEFSNIKTVDSSHVGKELPSNPPNSVAINRMNGNPKRLSQISYKPMKGYLKRKKIGGFSTYVDSWFVLDTVFLTEYKTSNESDKPRKVINLTRCSLKYSPMVVGYPNAFALLLSDQHSLVFLTPDEIQLVEWITSLKNVCAESEIVWKTQSILEAFNDGLLVTSETGLILQANQYVLSMLNYKRDDVIGLNLEQIIPRIFVGKDDLTQSNRVSSRNLSQFIGNQRRMFANKSDSNKVKVITNVGQYTCGVNNYTVVTIKLESSSIDLKLLQENLETLLDSTIDGVTIEVKEKLREGLRKIYDSNYNAANLSTSTDSLTSSAITSSSLPTLTTPSTTTTITTTTCTSNPTITIPSTSIEPQLIKETIQETPACIYVSQPELVVNEKGEEKVELKLTPAICETVTTQITTNITPSPFETTLSFVNDMFTSVVSNIQNFQYTLYILFTVSAFFTLIHLLPRTQLLFTLNSMLIGFCFALVYFLLFHSVKQEYLKSYSIQTTPKATTNISLKT